MGIAKQQQIEWMAGQPHCPHCGEELEPEEIDEEVCPACGKSFGNRARREWEEENKSLR